MKFAGWRSEALFLRGVVIERHVVPRADCRTHSLSAKCWCKPIEADDADKLYTHVSADGREVVEKHEGTIH